MFSERVTEACRSEFCLLIYVSMWGLRRRNCIRLVGIAVLSGASIPSQKSHKRKDGKIRILQLIRKMSFYEVNDTISRSKKKKKGKQKAPTNQKVELFTHHRQQHCLHIPNGNFLSLGDNLLVLPYHSSSHG